jgi:anti-sigma regulatory factor (Ser/Thr protein kinase)
VVDDATLLTSELVSNAVKYAGGPVIVAITCDRRKLSVEVHDPSPTPPVVRPPSAARPGGRGMWLVATLAREWGCRADDGGKTVWFSLAS